MNKEKAINEIIRQWGHSEEVLETAAALINSFLMARKGYIDTDNIRIFRRAMKQTSDMYDKEIENCIQAMEYASDLYDMETYMQARERYKELTGYYPGKQRLNSLYGRMDRKDDNNAKD